MGNKTGWLPKGLVCNNKTNCDDGADEIGIPFYCMSGWC